jgi:hypothetical protein
MLIRFSIQPVGLCYKHMTIVNDDSSGISKWVSKLIDDARVIIYDCNIFIIHAIVPAKSNIYEQGWSLPQMKHLTMLHSEDTLLALLENLVLDRWY